MHEYAYTEANQRPRQTFTAGNYTDYAYDDIGQLKTATGKESGGTTRQHKQFGYAYDKAWNVAWRTNNALVQEFKTNPLNELTNVARTGTLTVAGNVTIPSASVTVRRHARFFARIFLQIPGNGVKAVCDGLAALR